MLHFLTLTLGQYLFLQTLNANAQKRFIFEHFAYSKNLVFANICYYPFISIEIPKKL
jgi:hypothetical protein